MPILDCDIGQKLSAKHLSYRTRDVMVIYHFPCLESKWCTFRVVSVKNFQLQRNVCKSSHFFAVGMSQTDFRVQFLNTYLGYQSRAFAAVLFSRK